MCKYILQELFLKLLGVVNSKLDLKKFRSTTLSNGAFFIRLLLQLDGVHFMLTWIDTYRTLGHATTSRSNRKLSVFVNIEFSS